MAEGDNDDDKQHEPTQKKLDDARKKGEIPRSADLTTAASFAGMVLVSTAFGATSLGDVGQTLVSIIENSNHFSQDLFDGGGNRFGGDLMASLVRSIAVWFVLPAAAALAALAAQRALIFTPDKLKPKLSRISPLSNAKNKFGRAGLFEFAKSSVKLFIFLAVLGVFLAENLPDILESISQNDRSVVSLLLQICVRFTTLVLLVAGLIGGVDFLWQKQEHVRKNRMSHKELMDEIKQSEGDPQLKQQRRQKGYAIAMNKMLEDVPGADVVIVNPEHYAVALTWSRLPGSAPVCVAKGVDEVAARIRAIAAESGVPIHRDPPTARAIHATVDIGREILPEQFQPVAAAIRFAEDMRKKAKELGVKRP